MRYRLSTLLVAMVWVGLVCLALRSPNYWWSGGMFAVLVLVLLTSVLVAIYRTGQLRAMAVGFVTFGAGYLVIEQIDSWPGLATLGFPTYDLIDRSFVVLHGASRTASQGDAQDRLDAQVYERRQNAFTGICISTLTIVVGVLGGIIAQVLYHTRPDEKPPPPSISG
jgi:hypothetical protein